MRVIKNFLNKYVLVIIFVLIWEVSSDLGFVSPVFVPPFSKVIESIADMIVDGTFFGNLGISLLRAGLGFMIAAVIGVLLGFLLGGWFKKLNLFLDMVLEVCSQLNPFLILHIVLLFLGIGEKSKITIIAWTAIWPIIFSTINAIKNVNPNLIKMGKSFGLKRSGVFFKIVLPSGAPTIFNGLRIGAGQALMILTAAEMMGSESGLGYLIVSSEENFRITQMYASVLVIAFVALIVDYIMGKIQKKVVRFDEGGVLNADY